MTSSDTIVSKPGFLTITQKENPAYIYFNWEDFQISLEDVVDAFKKAENAMVAYGVFHIVSDFTKVTTGLRPEVAQWWGEVCMPSLAKCGVKLIVNLLPDSAIAQKSTDTGPDEVMNGIVLQKAGSVSDAESLVRAFQGRKTH